MKKILFSIGCTLFIFLAGCGRQEQSGTKEYRIFYVDKEETKVSDSPVEIADGTTEDVLQELFLALKTQPADAAFRSAIPDGVNLESFSFAENQLVLNFDTGYSTLSVTGEVLSRAAIVRTLCQVDGVNYVAFQVAGEPLVNVSGAPVGYMAADQFVDNAGNEISAYEKIALTLYFADESGSGLEAHLVERVYNSNISVDKLVVEEVIAGPGGKESEENGYATVSDKTKVIGVTTRDGVCYVNLDDEFLTKQGNVTPEVTIYSIVNSLSELPAVNKVQISVNGSTDLIYMEKIPLSQVFERNLEIMGAQ